jgi:methyltransferase
MVVAERNRALSRAQGGVEFGAGHYPVMVALHAALLAGCLIEPLAFHRPFIPRLGWPSSAWTGSPEARTGSCPTRTMWQ